VVSRQLAPVMSGAMKTLTELVDAVISERPGEPREFRGGHDIYPFRELTLERVDRVLENGGLRAGQLSLGRPGRPVSRREYRRTPSYPGLDLPETLDYAVIERCLRDGNTLVLHSCDQWLPDLATATDQLRDHVRHPVLAVMFVTPGREDGLELHADAFENFVFQLEGRKSWEVFDQLPGRIPEQPLKREQLGQARVTTTLAPGDILYLPRGCPHVAHAETFSLHVTIGILPLTLRGLLTAILSQRSGLPAEFDQPVPFARDSSDALRSVIQPGVDALVRQLSTEEWPEVLGRAVGPLSPMWQPGMMEHLASSSNEPA
jgi:hypothetical protein